MSERSVTATQFKAQCLGLLDEVASNGTSLVVTKRGQPVARIVPALPPDDLRGSVAYLVDDEELISPLEDWQRPVE